MKHIKCYFSDIEYKKQCIWIGDIVLFKNNKIGKIQCIYKDNKNKIYVIYYNKHLINRSIKENYQFGQREFDNIGRYNISYCKNLELFENVSLILQINDNYDINHRLEDCQIARRVFIISHNEPI